MATNKKPRKKFVLKNSAQQSLNNVAYIMKNNCVKLSDSYDLLFTLQHMYFIQVAARESKWNIAKLVYLNKIKNAISRSLEQIIKQCGVNEEGNYIGNPSKQVTIYKQTRLKIMWGVIKFYQLTADLINTLHPSKKAKYIIEAKYLLDANLLITNSKIANFINK
jgi:hypothetical protein